MRCKSCRLFRRSYLLVQLVLENIDAIYINHLRRLIHSLLVILGIILHFLACSLRSLLFDHCWSLSRSACKSWPSFHGKISFQRTFACHCKSSMAAHWHTTSTGMGPILILVVLHQVYQSSGRSSIYCLLHVSWSRWNCRSSSHIWQVYHTAKFMLKRSHGL